MTRCSVCGDLYPDEALLLGDSGKICATCELDAQEGERAIGGRIALAVGAPVAVFGGFTMYCLPLVGPFVGLFFGALGTATAIGAIQQGWLLVREDRQDPWGAGLMAGGILITLAGLFQMLFGLYLLLTMLWNVAT